MARSVATFVLTNCSRHAVYIVRASNKSRTGRALRLSECVEGRCRASKLKSDWSRAKGGERRERTDWYRWTPRNPTLNLNPKPGKMESLGFRVSYQSYHMVPSFPIFPCLNKGALCLPLFKLSYGIHHYITTKRRTWCHECNALPTELNKAIALANIVILNQNHN